MNGPSAAGKSRSTANATRALYPDRPVLAPERSPGRLDRLLDQDAVPEHAVIWLDDLDRHLDREGLTAATVRRLLAIDGVRIVATMREAAYEQYKPRGEIRPAWRQLPSNQRAAISAS